MNTLDFIVKKFGVVLQPDTEHRLNGQTMPIDLPINRAQLAQLFAELDFKSGAEIGVEQGEYSEVLAKANLERELYLVDPWKSYRGYRDHVSQEKLDGFYEATRQRMARHPGVRIVRKTSMEAVKDFKDGSIDYAFLDANHSFDYIVCDIIEWSKKVRVGGIVSGHDYFVSKQGSNHQVPIAVKAYAEAHRISPWFVCRGDHSPTWLWVKT